KVPLSVLTSMTFRRGFAATVRTFICVPRSAVARSAAGSVSMRRPSSACHRPGPTSQPAVRVGTRARAAEDDRPSTRGTRSRLAAVCPRRIALPPTVTLWESPINDTVRQAPGDEGRPGVILDYDAGDLVSGFNPGEI